MAALDSHAGTILLYDLAGADDERRISPFCWRIRMALAHKGLAVQAIPWRMIEKEQIAASGETTVPVIVDAACVVGNSWSIAEYLDAKYPALPLFESPQARAYCLWIHHWTERTLHPLIVPIILEDVLAVLHPMDKAYFRQTREKAYRKTLEEVFDRSPEAYERLSRAMAPLRRLLQQSTFIGGSEPGYGDYIVFGALQWARCCSPQPILAKPDDPIVAWFARMLDLHAGLGRAAKSYPTLADAHAQDTGVDDK
jgi:glutathione S-transferase